LFKILLLTHARELGKRRNSGVVAASAAPEFVYIEEWSRVDYVAHQHWPKETVLLWPDDPLIPQTPQVGRSSRSIELLVIIDATWQDARKIFNRSEYLQSLPRVRLSPGFESRGVRRNQREGGLSTCECVAEVLRAQGKLPEAHRVEVAFAQFVERIEKGLG